MFQKIAAYILASALFCGAMSASALAADAGFASQSVTVDGQAYTFDVYKAGGGNYFLLRDIARLLDIDLYLEDGVIAVDTANPYGRHDAAGAQTPAQPSHEPPAAEAPAASGEENADGWALAVLDDALQKLTDEGAASYQPEGHLFEFTSVDSGAVPLLNGEAIARYAENAVAVTGKVIYGVFHQGAYSQPDAVSVYEQGPANAALPRFTPTVSDGSPVLEGVDAARFAGAIEECETLIVHGGFEYSRWKDYYGPGMDRVGTATLVFVIDAVGRTVLHVESLGIDTPGVTTHNPTGFTMHEEAASYIEGLLRE